MTRAEETREQLEKFSRLVEDLAKQAVLLATNADSWGHVQDWDKLRKAARALRRPDPTPVPKGDAE